MKKPIINMDKCYFLLQHPMIPAEERYDGQPH